MEGGESHQPEYISRRACVIILAESGNAAVQHAYALDRVPDPERIRAITDRWRPFRSWVSVMLRAVLEDATQEIAGDCRPA